MRFTLLVSTVLRNAMPGEASGRLHLIDALRSPVGVVFPPDSPSRNLDPNPRGGTRGARGVAVGDNEIFVANFDSVFRYDPAWNLKSVISHPQCADIHDIALRDGRLWVASTRNDRLMQFDLDGKLKDCVDPWAMGFIEDTFGVTRGAHGDADDLRDPRTHDPSQTDRLHLNSFAFTNDGDLMLSLGQVRVNAHCESALLRVGAAGGADIVHRRYDAPVPAHNVLVMSEGSILHADTANGEVIAVATGSDERTQSIIATGSGYTRGLCRLCDGRIAVGVQNEVWLFDPVDTRNIQRICLSDDLRESVHSIATLDG